MLIHTREQPPQGILLDLTHLQLLALQNIPITPSTLSRPAANHGIQSPLLEPSLQVGLDFSILLSFGKDSLDVSGLFDFGRFTGFGGGLGGGGSRSRGRRLESFDDGLSVL